MTNNFLYINPSEFIEDYNSLKKYVLDGAKNDYFFLENIALRAQSVFEIKTTEKKLRNIIYQIIYELLLDKEIFIMNANFQEIRQCTCVEMDEIIECIRNLEQAWSKINFRMPLPNELIWLVAIEPLIIEDEQFGNRIKIEVIKSSFYQTSNKQVQLHLSNNSRCYDLAIDISELIKIKTKLNAYLSDNISKLYLEFSSKNQINNNTDFSQLLITEMKTQSTADQDISIHLNKNNASKLLSFVQLILELKS